MTIQQQYYTSCRKSDKSGFQVKAESQGIENNARQLLNQSIGYQIPYQSDSAAIDTHPIGLRYFTRDNLAFLVCSQSSGKDEFGRDGNFFAHSTISTPQELCALSAPIFYWKSPFWVSQDASDTLELPPLEEFDAEVTFDFEAIWSFLEQGNRREWFYKLLCAVIDYEQSKRKIVILDENESIAFWIACVSMAFPSRYIQFLSFATYHHDPYTAPFIITGTTADANFRFTNDEYYSYFILNVPQNRISEVPDSDYAQHLTQSFTSEQYEGEVLDFFYWLERYDSERVITRHLDDYTNFRRATTLHSLAANSPQALEGTRWVIHELYAKNSLAEEDLFDLKSASQVLGEVVTQSTVTSDLLESYIQALEKQKDSDPDYIQTAPNAIETFAKLVLNNQQQEAKILESKLGTIYPQDVFFEKINDRALVEKIAQNLDSQNPDKILLFWQLLGKKMTLSPSTENAFTVFLEKSFTVIPDRELSKRFNAPSLLIQVLDTVLKIPGVTTEFILICASHYKQRFPNSPMLEWVYYDLARRITVDQRVRLFWPYWKTYEDLVPDLSGYEIQRDLLTSSNISTSIQVIDIWITKLANINEDACFVILEKALEFLWTRVDRKQLSYQLLSHRINSFLAPNLFNQLVNEILSDAGIAKPSEQLATLYDRILTDSRLAIKQTYETIIRGSLDLRYQKLTESKLDEYFNYFAGLESEEYEQEAGEFLNGFFATRGTFNPQDHFNVVEVTYIKKHRDLFWEIYWYQFNKSLFSEQQRIDNVLQALDYWFNAKTYFSDGLPYFIPDFFMRLPEYLKAIKKNKGYDRIKDKFERGLSQKNWYQVVEPFINDKSEQGWLKLPNMWFGN
jgi:GTPase-associated protein 1, N-terminal domain type 2/GTPase-associated protein 1, middle domain